MRVFYSPEYVAAKHAFDTTRKSAAVARSLVDSPIKGVDVVRPSPARENELALAHAVEYINAVKTGKPRDLAQSNGFKWDKGMWLATQYSTGGVIQAALNAATTGENTGSLSSGLHHASVNEGGGFCTFNGLAVAALMLADAGKRVLIIDFDAHNGGGTYDCVGGVPGVVQINVSTNSFDEYDDADHNFNVIVKSGRYYLEACEAALKSVDPSDYDVILYNAGMDPHQDCSTGGLWGITTGVLARRESAVFAWAREAGVPVAWVLAGGYQGMRLDEQALVDLHRLTIIYAL